MVYQKFIIEDGNLIASKCTYHNQLSIVASNVKGGGWWRLKDGVMTFYGDSHEFGEAKIEDIEKAIRQSKVYQSPTLSCNISGKYKFQYDTQSEIIKLN